MAYCCVPLCNSKFVKSGDISFHEIPAEGNIREKWLSVISRKDWTPNITSNYTRVCSKHFLSSDYKPNTKYRCLLKTAIPSQFPDYPRYLQPPKKKMKIALAVKKNSLNIQENQPQPSIDNANENPVIDTEINPIASNYTRDCSKQFLNSDYKPNTKRRCLLKTAIPSQLPDYSHYLQPPKNMRTNLAVQKKNSLSIQQNQPQSTILIDNADNENENPVMDVEINSVTKYCDKDIQVDVISMKKNRELSYLKLKNKRQSEKMQKLQKQLDEAREKLQNMESNTYVQSMLKIVKVATSNDIGAVFLKNLVENFERKKPSYDDVTIRECLKWRANFPLGYEYARRNSLLKLPSRLTFSRYQKSSKTS